MIENKDGLLIVVSGPSGVGKGSVCEALLKNCDRLWRSISVTTRSPRVGEVEGVNYFYKTNAEYDDMLSSDQFLEHFEIYGNRYGTPRCAVEQKLKDGFDVLLEIDVQGGLLVKRNFSDAILVFIMPPNIPELEARLRGRKTEDEATIQRRLGAARGELDKANLYDYTITNVNIEVTAQNICTIVNQIRNSR